MTHRIEQVESLLRRAISQVIIRDISDPRIAGMVSITRIEVAKDMRDARVFVSVIPEKYEKRTIAGLKAAVGRIHSKVAQNVRMRYVPRFDFRLDPTFKKEAEVFDAIQKGLDREGLLPGDVANSEATAPSELAPDSQANDVGAGELPSEVLNEVSNEVADEVKDDASVNESQDN